MFAPSRNTVVYISPIGDYAGHAQREARWIEAGRAPAVLEVYDLRTPADIMDVVEQLTPATPDTFARQVVEAPMPPKTGNPTVHFLLPTDADLRVYEPRRGLTVNGIGPDHGYRLTTVSSNGADAERTATPGGSAVRGHPVVDDGDRGLGWVEGGAYVSLTGGPDARALAESLTTATDAQWERWIFGVSDP